MLKAVAANLGKPVKLQAGFSTADIDRFLSNPSDGKLLAVDQEGAAVGHCSLWHENTPAINGERTGFIGHFAATDKEAADVLLESACQGLVKVGASVAVGPIDGDTWHRYRFVTKRGDRRPFFLEPDHPDDWPGYFKQAGFEALATYFSAEANDLTIRRPKLVALAQKFSSQGITIRSINLDRFDEELARLHALSVLAFADNFLYTPIHLNDFMAMYAPIRDRLLPELVMLAEANGELIGFVFGLPDLRQAASGEAVDTVIIKTLAIEPGRRTAGLGGLLLERCQLQAHAMGFRRVIHALMHASNKSLNLSAHYAKPFRTYTLFSKRLKP